MLLLFAYAEAYTPPLVANVLFAHESAASNLRALSSVVHATYLFVAAPGTGCPIAMSVMPIGTHLSARPQFALMFAAVQSIRAKSPGEEMMFFALLSYLPGPTPPPFCSIIELVTLRLLKSANVK